MTENCKGGYLPYKNGESMIYFLPQGIDVQLQLLVRINVFEVQELLL